FLKGAVIAAALALQPLAAGAAAPAASLSATDRADVSRVEQYLNSIRTVAARFMQSSEGHVALGNFYLERPGKMRIQYDPPDPLFMVASGIYLSVYDPQLKQASYLPIESTPAYFLVKDKVGFEDNVTVSKVEHGLDALRVTLHDKGHPDQGRITLVFSDKPLLLKKWTVIDRDGKAIDVALMDPQFDTKLDPSLFKFVDPSPSPNVGRGN
ncbi:MAG: outer membrane lipoprotein carrier protein LolA, partial [Alphaproteobacteria bacterium]